MSMLWQSVISSIFYFLFFCLTSTLYSFLFCLTSIFNLLLVLLAPLIHLINYITHGFLIPIHFLGKFEILYIYLGVAALIGLLTGFVLHFSSNMLMRILNLHSSPEEAGRTAASVRAAREKRRLEDAWKTSTFLRSNQRRTRPDDASKDYTEYLEKDRGRRRQGQGLLSQTILEEDDDSEGGF